MMSRERIATRDVRDELHVPILSKPSQKGALMPPCDGAHGASIGCR